MRPISFARLATLSLLLAALLLPPAFTTEAVAPPPPAPPAQSENIGVNGFFSVDPAQQGTTFQAAVVMDIPRGLRVTPVSYPRGAVRTFRFGGASAERLAVYEGRAIMRFNVTVPAGYELGVARIRANVQFQSCSDEVCFPPTRRELVLPIAIVNRDTPVNRINQRFFGGGGRRRR